MNPEKELLDLIDLYPTTSKSKILNLGLRGFLLFRDFLIGFIIHARHNNFRLKTGYFILSFVLKVAYGINYIIAEALVFAIFRPNSVYVNVIYKQIENLVFSCPVLAPTQIICPSIGISESFNHDLYSLHEIMMRPQIKISKSWLEKFCVEHHIIKMSLFGSVISNHFTVASDIDMLVEFDPKHIPGLFSFVEMRDLLTEHFGREVDLRTSEDISKLFRNEVIKQSYHIYGKERFKPT